MQHAQRLEPVDLSPPAKTSFFVLLFLGITGSLALFASLYGADLVDDTYIFLRYADNIAHGYGATFNHTERVEGFSSPLWTFLLAAVGLISSDFEVASWWCGVLLAASIVTCLAAATPQQPPACNACQTSSTLARGLWNIILLATLCTSPILVFWAGSGMDAVLFTFTVTLVLLSLLQDQQANGLSWRTAALLALATATRMEGIALAGYCFLVMAIQRKRLVPIMGYAAFVAVGLFIRWSYYGSLVPNTFHAKVTKDIPSRIASGLGYLGEAGLVYLPLAVGLLIAMLVAWQLRASRERLMISGGWIGLWMCYILYTGGDNFAVHRFLLPIVPALALIMVDVVQRSTAAMQGTNTSLRQAVAMLAVIAGAATSHLWAYHVEAPKQFGDIRLAQAWCATGDWLAHNTPEDAIIASPVPGAMAYRSKRHVIDMLGLTDAQVARFGQVYSAAAHGHGRYHTEYMFSRSPDVVVYISSGRFHQPKYADPDRISKKFSYALYDFVHDPRCEAGYEYRTARLDDGTIVEMQQKRDIQLASTAQSSP